MRLAFAAPLILLLLLSATWRLSPPLFTPGPPGTFDETAVKDPSIVFAEGQWRLFYTARGQSLYSLGYASAPTLEGLRTARHIPLPQTRGVKGPYAAAPQVFYFRPQEKWYLIFQTTDRHYQPVYSTTTTVGNPESWTRPTPLLDHQGTDKWIDFWVICDDRQAYLFFTRDHREVVVMKTTLKDFPNGFHDPQPVYGPLIEAAHIYRVKGEPARYQMLFEIADGTLRKFGLATAGQLPGPWHTETLDYATGPQLLPGSNAKVWTNEVSHGELIRTSSDERLEVPAKPVQFLIQGLPAQQHTGDYPSLPWHIGLISR